MSRLCFAGETINTWAQLLKTNDVITYNLLQFQMLISDLRHYFLLKKCEELLQCIIQQQQKLSVFGYKVLKC